MTHLLAVAMYFAGLLTRPREGYIYTRICTDCLHQNTTFRKGLNVPTFIVQYIGNHVKGHVGTWLKNLQSPISQDYGFSLI
jgi:hypothetical protein